MRAACDSLRRMRPLLGTYVEIGAAGASMEIMEAAVEAAFAAIATVHRLMSFHDEESDVGRLNRHAWQAPVEVHSWTFQVLQAALDMNARSNGLFDIRIAPTLQRLGLLPDHAGDHSAWRSLASGSGDIELLADKRVRFGSSGTRIDLGGIAKGFAVDRAIGVMRELGIPSGAISAGGDIRVFGQNGKTITIRHPAQPHLALCEITLREAALASSGAQFDPVEAFRVEKPAVIDPARGEAVSAILGASVKAHSCLLADALTKVVMLGGLTSASVLRHYGASAVLVSAEGEVYATPEWNDSAVLAA